MPPPIPPDQNLADAFGRAARTHPSRTAVVEGERRVGFAELDALSASIAAGLRERGVGAGGAVLVALPRGVDCVATVLGIVRCGGVYVPVDPAWPAPRIEHLRRIVRPAMTVGVDGAGGGAGAFATPDQLARSRGGITPAGTGANDPCYVMFTSGTTGEPKGVVVPHRAVLRLVIGPDFMELAPGRSWLHLSATSFDASTLEVWAPLLNGGCCVTVPDRLPSLERISSIIRGAGITDAWLTASLFNAMVDHEPEAFGGMRQVLTGGERVCPEHARRFIERHPGVRLINGYGPTENTTFTCCHTITIEDTANPAGIPIGRPIRGTEAAIVDEQGEECPAGSPGELLAGGLGVALGYAGDEALTAERFVNLAGRSGTWYRTGDIARRRGDSVIEYLGRRDRQVKVRGFRIELEEVERSVTAHPGVRHAFALVLGDRADLNRLAVAYTTRTPDAPTAESLRAWLGERQPGHLVPDLLAVLPEIPIGPTGKADQDVIRARFRGSGDAPPVREGPDAWRALESMLGVLVPGARVHPGAGFLEIGGSSIAALRLAARLRAEFGVEVPIGRILACTELRGLAGAIASATPGGESPAAVEIDEPPAATSLQEQMYIESALDPTGSAYHEYAAFRCGPGIDLAALERAWRALVRRHEALRTRLEFGEGVLTPAVEPPEASERSVFEVHPPTAWDESGVPEAVRRIIGARFDLGREFPARMHVFGREDGGADVVVVLHHAFVDEWSLRLIRDELGRLYAGMDPLPPAMPFRRFAAYERSRRREEEVERAADRLLGLTPAGVSLGRSPGAGVDRVLRFAPDAGATLASMAREAGCTPAAFLIAHFAGVILSVLGRSRVMILTPLAHRAEPALQDIVGCCNLMHPVVIDANGGDSPLAAQRELLAGYDRPLAPFTEVVRCVQKRGRLQGGIVEFGFALRTDSDFAPEFPGVRVAPLACPNGAARFPLSMLLDQTGGVLTGVLRAPEGSHACELLPAIQDAFARRLAPLHAGGSNGARDPDGASTRSETASGAPRASAPLIAHARRAWEELTGSRVVTEESNFFDMGGNSLMLLRLAARIREATGVELAFHRFLDHPTFGHLVACLASVSEDRPMDSAVATEVFGSGGREILGLPGALGRPIVFNHLAKELAGPSPDGYALRAYHLYDAIAKHGAERGLERLLARLAEDIRRPEVGAIVGYSVGGLLPFLLDDIPPEVESRVLLCLIDVYPPTVTRSPGSRLIEIARNTLGRPSRIPLALIDSATIAGRLARVRLFPELPGVGLSPAEIAELRRVILARRLCPWKGRVTVCIASRKPIWQPYFDERMRNGMGPYLPPGHRLLTLPYMHQDLLRGGAGAIAREIREGMKAGDS
jgi:amino acid adenylation domain-containing protein